MSLPETTDWGIHNACSQRRWGGGGGEREWERERERKAMPRDSLSKQCMAQRKALIGLLGQALSERTLELPASKLFPSV